MRTTLDIDDHLLKTAKKAAADRGVPLRQVVEEGLSLLMRQPKHTGRRRPLRWKTTRGPTLPGVDFTDRDRLYDLMDGRG